MRNQPSRADDSVFSYEANQFSFDKLVPWLRSHVTQDPPADLPR